MQKLAEAQDFTEVLLNAKVKMGELIASMPREKNQYESSINNAFTSTKEQALKEIGFAYTPALYTPVVR